MCFRVPAADAKMSQVGSFFRVRVPNSNHVYLVGSNERNLPTLKYGTTSWGWVQ